MKSAMKTKGFVDAVINYKDGTKIELAFPNTIMKSGREALVKTLTNQISSDYTNLYVTRMVFGDGGTSGGNVLLVDVNATGLYGVTRASKSVIGQINPNNSTQAIFTSVLGYDDANGFSLSEMGLLLNDGTMYSMVTFADLSKTSSMSITWNWTVSMI